MKPAFFSLLLTAVHVCVLVECRPRLHHPEQQPQRQHSSLDRGAHADTPAGPARFYLELSGSVQRVAHRDSLGKSACMHTNSFITDGKEKLFNLKCKNFRIFKFKSSKLENEANGDKLLLTNTCCNWGAHSLFNRSSTQTNKISRRYKYKRWNLCKNTMYWY